MVVNANGNSGIFGNVNWIEVASSPTAMHFGAPHEAEIARQDFEDIARADVVVVFNPAAAGSIGRGGRHVETGYALALGKRVILVGARGNVFQWLRTLLLCPTGMRSSRCRRRS